MSEENTQQLPPFEGRIIAVITELRADMRNEFAAMNARLTSFDTHLTSLDTHLTSLDTHLASLDTRLTSLEEKVDARLRETRPIWEGVQTRLTGIESELNNLNRQLRAMIADLFQVRVRVEKLEDSQPTA